MKKVLLQLCQWISKNKKKLIYGALALFIGQICFFGLGGIGVENVVFADDGGSTDPQKMVTMLYDLSAVVSKMIYIVLYPLFMIAGKLVDNSFVYGEVFNFDAILWNLWVMVRNIANFALGFIFIFYIFRYIIKPDQKRDPKWLIIRSLIAGVLIQASWFVMAALIDVSTIVTYGVGGLPIYVLGTDEEDSLKYNPYILNTVVSVDAKNPDTYHVYLSDLSGTQFISTCKTFVYSATGANNVKIEEELILSPEMVYYRSGTDECYMTQPGRCHIGDQVYKLGNDPCREETPTSCDALQDYQRTKEEDDSGYILHYKSYSLTEIEDAVSGGSLLRIGQTGTNFGLDEGSKSIGEEWGSHRINDILSGSYVGVFGALYGSLLNAGADLRISKTTTTEASTYVGFLNTALSLGHMVAISIPLIVMLVVFMIRICVLWVAIALSPIIVLIKVFDDIEKKVDELGKEVKFLNYLKVENLIGIIFSPAIICFAVAISTVLIRAISIENTAMVEAINKPILGGLVDVSLAGVGINIGKMIISIIGIAITRFLVWAAVKSSAIGKQSSIISGLHDFAKNTLGSIPIVPIPNLKEGGFSMVGTSALKNLPSKISGEVKRKYGTQSDNALQDLLDPSRVDKRRAEAYKNKLLESPIDNWATTGKIKIESGNGFYEYSFSQLSHDDQKDVINRINSLTDENIRRAFGQQKLVKIGDITYEFVEETKQKNGETKKVFKYQQQKE